MPQATTLNLGSKHLYIFGTLYKGLTEIQKRISRMQGPVHVWADAVCINQGNVDEVNSQVKIMDQIYSQATAVLVWLGPDATGDMAQVREMLAKLEAMYLHIDEISTREGIKLGDLVRRDMSNLLRFSELAAVDDEKWRVLLAFFRRLWFRRLWIIQEVALAREIMVWCGGETLSWTAIERCAEILYIKLEKVRLIKHHSRTDTSITFYSGHVNLISFIRKWFTDGAPGAPPNQFANQYKLITGREQFDNSFAYFLLGNLLGSLATDPRDKIFGILGILRKLSPSGSYFIDVDYTLDAAEVYTRATRKILSDTNWLGLLSLVRTGECPPNSRLPSWVPDFAPTGFNRFIFDSDPSFNVTERFRVNFANNKTHKLAFHGNSLQLTGHRVAVVRSQSERLAEFYNYKVNFENGAKLVLELEVDGKYLPTGEYLVDALWKTLIANGHSGMPEEDGRASFLSFWLLHFLVLAVRERNSKRTPVETFVETMPNLETLAQYDAFISLPGHAAIIDGFKRREQDQAWVDNLTQLCYPYALALSVWGLPRVLFSTREGHLGIGHESLQDGDEVWVSPNGPVPLILRPIISGPADRFSLVGECYVHGIMYGELFDNEEPSWQRIWLV